MYRMQSEAVIYNKMRNNEIAAVADWDVPRFTTRHIEQDLDWTMRTIGRKVSLLGELKYAQEDSVHIIPKMTISQICFPQRTNLTL